MAVTDGLIGGFLAHTVFSSFFIGILSLSPSLILPMFRKKEGENGAQKKMGESIKSIFSYVSHRHYYLSSVFKSIIYVKDANYNSGRLYLKALDALDFPAISRFTFSRIPKNRAERILRGMTAERRSEIRIASTSNSILRNELSEQLAALDEMSGRLNNGGTEIYNARIAYRIESPSPVELTNALNRFRNAMSVLGFSTELESDHCRNPIMKYSSLSERPGKDYLMDSYHISQILPVFFEKRPSSGGILAGLSDDTEKPLFMNMFDRNSYNMIIFGETGSGKSFFSKLMLRRHYISGKVDRIIIFDPLDEYSCSIFGKSCLELRMNSGEYIDPLQRAGSDADSVSAISSLVSDFTDNQGMSETEIAGIVRMYLNSEGDPNINGLLSFLLQNSEDNAFRSKLAEIRDSIFSNLITISDQNEPKVMILKFGKLVGESLQKAMAVSLFNAHNIARENSDQKKIILIDEAHLLTSSRPGRKMLVGLARHARHYSTSVINVTQNFTDFLSEPDAESIMLNSGTVVLFRTREKLEAGKEYIPGYVNDLEPSYLMGGSRDPYSECYYFYSNTVRRVRVISTLLEKNTIDY